MKEEYVTIGVFEWLIVKRYELDGEKRIIVFCEETGQTMDCKDTF